MRTPGQYPDDFEVPGPSPYQQYESEDESEDESEEGGFEEGDFEEGGFEEGGFEEGGFEEGGFEQGVSEQHEDELPPTRHGTPEPFPPPYQPDAPRILVSEPGSPSNRSVASGNFPQASAFGMGGMLYPSMDNPHAYLQEDPSQGLSYGTPIPIRPADSGSSGGSVEGSSPQFQPSVSPHPLSSAHGSMVGQGSPSPLGSGSVEASPSVQELSPATYLYQRGEYSGTVQQQKRGRESSSSSSAGNLRPQRKHHHGDQGPGVPQSIPEDQQGNTSLLGVGAFGPGGHAQPPPEDRGGSYGAPDPHGRADASEIQRISQAYASQSVHQPRPNLFAGIQRSAPSSYTAGAGRGYAHSTQDESSTQDALEHQYNPTQGINPSAVLFDKSGAGRGAAQPQYRPMQLVGPGAAPSNTGGPSGGYGPRLQPLVPRRHGGSAGARAVQPNPMQGMGASDVWKFISGQEGGDGGNNWEGPRFKVDEYKTTLWTPQQMHELQVIMASFESWDEVVSLGQQIPGQHTALGGAAKVSDLKYKIWSPDQDAEIRRLQSPWHEDRNIALKTLMSRYGRCKDEIIGRCMLFARSKQRLNLGVATQAGVSRLKARIQRQQ